MLTKRRGGKKIVPLAGKELFGQVKYERKKRKGEGKIKNRNMRAATFNPLFKRVAYLLFFVPCPH